MRTVQLLVALWSVVVLAAGCAKTENAVCRTISREPGNRYIAEQALREVPQSFEENAADTMINLCNADLTSLNFADKAELLTNAFFDTETVWPYRMPEGFNPKQLIEKGKTPGLDVGSIHRIGFTGKDVGIAIIGDIPNINHQEYRNRLVYYDEIRDFRFLKRDEASGKDEAQYKLRTDLNGTYKGTAACAAAAGKNLGTAPDANLYYISTVLDEKSKNYNEWVTEAIYRILDLNETLEPARRIRVLMINSEVVPTWEFYQALDRASDQKMLIVINRTIADTSLDGARYLLQTLRWDKEASPNESNSFEPSTELLKDLFWIGGMNLAFDVILVPGMNLTMASPTHNDSYCYATGESYDYSGFWLGGLYASACQARPELLPSEFLELAFETGKSIMITYKGKVKSLERIINPQKLFESMTGKK